VRKTSLAGVSIGLLAISLFISFIAVYASAEEEYSLKTSLQSLEPSSGAVFGSSVAISEDILVIGEPKGKVEDTAIGKAHIFDSDGNLLTTIQSPEPRSGAFFSNSVAVSGDTIVVGEYMFARSIDNWGRAYTFGSDGSLQSTLQAPIRGWWFSWSVAVSGDTVVVGDPHYEEENIPYSGRAYIFGSDGSLQSTFQAPTPISVGLFGRSVAADGDHIIIGEIPCSIATGTYLGPGSAYVYDSKEDLLTTLKSPDQEASINFGWSVAISESIIAVGESFAEVDGNSKAGRAYIFDTDGNLLTTLQAPTPEENAEFGNAVAISGDTVVVGEYKADVEAFNEGRAYVFDLDGNLLATLQAPTPGAAAGFGHSVAVSGDTIVVGEPNAIVDGKVKAGRAYIFGPGPGAKPEAETEPVSAQEEAKPAAEEKKPSGGIPGFPYESIITGLVIGAFVLWLLQRRR